VVTSLRLVASPLSNWALTMSVAAAEASAGLVRRLHLVEEQFLLLDATQLGCLDRIAQMMCRLCLDASSFAHVHRITDIAMLRYTLVLRLPQSQADEIVDHLTKSGHGGMSGDKLHELLDANSSGAG
jgi:hypothetical protein